MRPPPARQPDDDLPFPSEAFDPVAAQPVVRLGDPAALAAALAALLADLAVTLRATWRGTLTWFAAAGWATAALLVTSAWLLPWYLVWLLPLAALSGDRRLKAAALAIGGFVVYTRVDLWFGLA